MALTIVSSLPREIRSKGSIREGFGNLPAGRHTVNCRMPRNDWIESKDDVVRVVVEASSDGGKTWFLIVGFTTTGGSLLDSLGGVAESFAESQVVSDLALEVRTTMIILADSLDTKLVLERRQWL